MLVSISKIHILNSCSKFVFFGVRGNWAIEVEIPALPKCFYFFKCNRYKEIRKVIEICAIYTLRYENLIKNPLKRQTIFGC
jgi:hypothetical protein